MSNQVYSNNNEIYPQVESARFLIDKINNRKIVMEGPPAVGDILETVAISSGTYEDPEVMRFRPVSEVIADNLITTKGGLLTNDGSTVVQLPVGADRNVLQANSAVADGIEWTDNVLIQDLRVENEIKTDLINSLTGGGTVRIEGTDLRAVGTTVSEHTGDVDGTPATNSVQNIIESNRVCQTLVASDWDETQNNGVREVSNVGNVRHQVRETVSGANAEKTWQILRDPASLDYSAYYWNLNQTITTPLPLANPEDAINVSVSASPDLGLFVYHDNSTATNVRVCGSNYVMQSGGYYYNRTLAGPYTMSGFELINSIFRNTFGAITITYPSGVNMQNALGIAVNPALGNDARQINTQWTTLFINASGGTLTFATNTGHTFLGTAGATLATNQCRRVRHIKTGNTTYQTYREGADFAI